ncbi:MAG: hypothetical protein C0469_18185 [Cyanobacteria bacterium DS2.3.42]|nr:hypothetical protein [Cyanobacteria bacterium DS2.3.42]
MSVKQFKGGRGNFEGGGDDNYPPAERPSSRRPMDGNKPRNIQETQAWKDSTGGLQKLWKNYLNLLGRTFQQLTRAEQERYIERFSITIAVGAACVMSSFFYWFLPPLVRVLVVPVFIGAAWWAGAKLIAPQVIDRFAQYLKVEEQY